jgi:hypothetical protein
MENKKVFIKTEEEEDSDGVVSTPSAETGHIKTEEVWEPYGVASLPSADIKTER